MKILHGFTYEKNVHDYANHREIFVDKDVDVKFNSWCYDDSTLSGISVNVTLHELNIYIDIDAGFIFTKQEIEKIYNRDKSIKILKL